MIRIEGEELKADLSYGGTSQQQLWFQKLARNTDYSTATIFGSLLAILTFSVLYSVSMFQQMNRDLQ